jgi:hypothetical protein
LVKFVHLELFKELLGIADEEQLRIERQLPEDSVARLALFIETVRVLDFIMLGQPGVPKQDKTPFSVFDINMIEMGWNLASSMLLRKVNVNGFPMRQSTEESRRQVTSLLFQLGVIIQIRRTVEMAKSGLVNIEKNDSTYIFSVAPEAKEQFLDELELSALDKLEEKLKSSGKTYKNWELVDRNALGHVIWQVGNFMSVKYATEFATYKVENIDMQMIPLIKQWDSGNHGIMLGYDSTPEIDNHFLAIATELIADWRDEAGFHPDAKIGNISAAEIMAVAMMIISFHAKHISFAQLASERDHEILIPQSLSIWSSVQELIKDMSDFSRFDEVIVKEAVGMLTLKPEDADFLKKYTTSFRPLLIDIGSGFVFRPASSVIRNPLHSIYALLESRNSSLVDNIHPSREEWIRKYLYAMFAGTRYQRMDKNIKIRKDGNIITDIDAAIYDTLTGELALFQIKWQNFFTNDVKKLRSRAKNFVDEINLWTEKIESWINSQDISGVIKSLRLKGVGAKLSKSKIYLFGLGKNTARTGRYGYELNNDKIAVTSWAQFVRNRTDIGPAPKVISKLFQRLKEEENAKIERKPIPITIPLGNFTLYFKDIWSITED